METMIPSGPVFSVREHLESDYLLDLEDADRVRDEILLALKAMPSGGVLMIDLDGVTTRASCVARFIGTPLERIGDGEITDRYMVLRGPLDYLTERDVRMALEDEGVVAVVREAEESSLVGRTARVLEETYEALRGKREVTSADLVDQLGLDIKTANARMAKLEGVGLLHREGEVALETGGRRFLYRVVR